jgi:hypothetical protein
MTDKELPLEKQILLMNTDGEFDELIRLKMQLDADLKLLQERYLKYRTILDYEIILRGYVK